MNQYAPKSITLDLLDDHPGNPRLAYRQDVIDAIAANLNGDMLPEYSLLVRPIAKRYQIISPDYSPMLGDES